MRRRPGPSGATPRPCSEGIRTEAEQPRDPRVLQVGQRSQYNVPHQRVIKEPMETEESQQTLLCVHSVIHSLNKHTRNIYHVADNILDGEVTVMIKQIQILHASCPCNISKEQDQPESWEKLFPGGTNYSKKQTDRVGRVACPCICCGVLSEWPSSRPSSH